jgi:hypothetical protein
MKLLILLLALLVFACSTDNRGHVEATLRITSVKDSIDNAPIHASGSEISKYLFEKKAAEEVPRRIALGEAITIPKRIGTFEVWDGPINLSPEFIEIVFKQI